MEGTADGTTIRQDSSENNSTAIVADRPDTAPYDAEHILYTAEHAERLDTKKKTRGHDYSPNLPALDAAE